MSYYSAGPSRLAGDNREEESLLSAEANNRRLRQAIEYLAKESPGTSDQFEERLGLIEEYILNQFAEEGYSFDPKLYRQVKEMVRDHHHQLEDRDESEESEEMEELGTRPLYRHAEPFDSPPENRREAHERLKHAILGYLEQPSHGRQSKLNDEFSIAAGGASYPEVQRIVEEGLYGYDKLPEGLKGRLEQKFIPDTGNTSSAIEIDSSSEDDRPSSLAQVKEIRWTYGGPDNEPERWHDHAVSDLPFGETVYLANYQSDRIRDDLVASEKRRQDLKKNPNLSPVITNRTKAKRLVTNEFETGSRFKLPPISKEIMDFWNKESAKRGSIIPFKQAIQDFNTVTPEEIKDEGYAPRVKLPRFAFPGERKPTPDFQYTPPPSQPPAVAALYREYSPPPHSPTPEPEWSDTDAIEKDGVKVADKSARHKIQAVPPPPAPPPSSADKGGPAGKGGGKRPKKAPPKARQLHPEEDAPAPNAPKSPGRPRGRKPGAKPPKPKGPPRKKVVAEPPRSPYQLRSRGKKLAPSPRVTKEMAPSSPVKAGKGRRRGRPRKGDK